ncbi:hypothetical protein GCM10023091_10720 [Ravibacter arvi]|uniref:Uncharacterized protein n=1 Tax=Ravibacter arvi TaxID=2051041 RepID=A0ABP8LUA8_9BACT
MKNLRLLLLLFVFGTSVTYAQNTMQGLFAGNTKLTFLGTDFTKAKFVGAAGFTDPNAIKNQHIKSWNSLLVLEPKKFSLQGAFRISDPARYETNIDDLTRINQSVEVDANIAEKQHQIPEAEVDRIVSAYKLAPNEGVGIVYIAENLDKNAEEFTVWVTFIDLATRKVLLKEHVIAKPGGFGFRNYWAGAIYKVNKAIETKYYKIWAQKFK